MTIAFIILGQPVSMKNSRQIVIIGGKPASIKSKEARDYERDFLRQLPPAAKQMLTGPVRVTMRLFYQWEGPDLDESLLLDCMAAQYDHVKGALIKVAPGEYAEGPKKRVLVSKGVYENDRQVRSKRIDHFIDKLNPRAEIEVEALQMQQVAIPLVSAVDEKDPF